jgi:hypothetical protein
MGEWDFIWVWPLVGFGGIGFFTLMFHIWENAEKKEKEKHDIL